MAKGQVWGRKGGPRLYLVESVNPTSGDAICRDLNVGGLATVPNSVFDSLERKN